MAKRSATKMATTSAAAPPSSSTTTYRTNKDGTLMRKKAFWLEDELVHAFEVWCVTNRRDPGEMVAEFFRSVVGKKKA